VTASPPSPTSGDPSPRRGFRARYIVAAVVCVAVVAWLLVAGLAKNIVYLRPVSYAVAHRAAQGSHTFRMAGQVEPHSIAQVADGTKFMMTDGTASAAVDLQGSPPSLFKDCAPVVVEGKWDGTLFRGDRLLIRHGAEYSAKKRVEAADKKTGCPPAASS
jgi:cytochrome c-type biogenesis protein CcmE